MTMKPFRQGISAFDETRGLQDAIPLTTTIQALGHEALGTRIRLVLPDWESSHSDLNPRHNHMTKHIAKQVLESKLLPSAWIHDGGEALGNLGNKIFGGYKLATQIASPGSLSRLWVRVIDHHTNRYTPWFRNTQMLPHRLRILGNPRTQAIDLQIPTQLGQTSLEAILLTLQIMGCGENPQYDEFKTSRTLRIEPDQPEPIQSEHSGLLSLQPHSTLARTDRLTMFLPAREHTITWGSACLEEDTEILLADGTFVSLLHSIGQAIWTDQQDTRRIKRIHEFATLETDPPLYEIEGKWMTASHFTRKGPGEK